MSTQTTGQVQASASMYRTLAKTHLSESWGYTLAKEIWQNTIDIPATKLDILVQEVKFDKPVSGYDWIKKPSFSKVSFQDDGPGMSLDILKNIYLFYGETTKDREDDSVGGYGLGRVVCTFGAVNYRLRSQDWECTGAGSQYTLTTGLAMVDGFLLEVTIPDTSRIGYYKSTERGIVEYLSRCFSSRIKVSLNGKELVLEGYDTIKGETNDLLDKDDSSWGEYSYSRDNKISTWAVNSLGDGLHLNDENLYGVKLKGINLFVRAGLTKKTMNISRDSFNGDYAKAIEAIKASMYEMEKFNSEEQTFVEGKGMSFELPHKEIFEGNITKASDTQDVIEGLMQQSFQSAMAAVGKRMLGVAEEIEEKKQIKGNHEGLPYIFICTQADKPEYEAMKNDEKYETFYKIWHTLVNVLAEEVLLPICPDIGGKEINTAILLSKEAHGVCDSDNKYTIGGNPESITSFPLMVAAAMHEVCHIASMYHDEKFAMYLTFCMAGLYGVEFPELQSEWDSWKSENSTTKKKVVISSAKKKVIPSPKKKVIPSPKKRVIPAPKKKESEVENEDAVFKVIQEIIRSQHS